MWKHIQFIKPNRLFVWFISSRFPARCMQFVVCPWPLEGRRGAAQQRCCQPAALEDSFITFLGPKVMLFLSPEATHALLVTPQRPPGSTTGRSDAWTGLAAAAWHCSGPTSGFCQPRFLQGFVRSWHKAKESSATLTGSSYTTVSIICITMA